MFFPPNQNQNQEPTGNSSTNQPPPSQPPTNINYQQEWLDQIIPSYVGSVQQQSNLQQQEQQRTGLGFNLPPTSPSTTTTATTTTIPPSTTGGMMGLNQSPSMLTPTMAGLTPQQHDQLLIPYDMRMSSMYPSSGNYLENLYNDDSDDGLMGVCTDKRTQDAPFIQIIFKECVRITKMIIGVCTIHNWGRSYLQDSEIHYLNKNNKWEYLSKVDLLGERTDCEIVLKHPIETTSLRVRSGGDYIGLGKWRCYGQQQVPTWTTTLEKFPLDQTGTSFIDMVSIPYKLKMSSKNSFSENTVGSLMDANNLSVGAATNTSVNSYIEAVFLTPVPQPITHIALKPLKKNGWGVKFSNDILLEYSDNGLDWKLLQRLKDVNEQLPPISLSQAIVSSHWRVRRVEEGYVSLGLFKFYTYQHMFNNQQEQQQITTPISSKPIHYDLKMSKCDKNCANTFHSLQDLSGKGGGAGTQKVSKPFVQASFDRIYTLTSLDIRPVRKFDWGAEYLKTSTIQYSNDEKHWSDVTSLRNVTEELTSIVLDNIPARYLRIINFSDEGYVGVGCLIVYGV